MKAAQIATYGDPDVIIVTDAPTPRPDEDQVLIEVNAASLNPFDTTIRTGSMRDVIALTFPVTLGGDFAGIVTKTGTGVTSLSVGDHVYGQASVVAGNSGAFADFAVTKATQTAHMPANTSFLEAASLPLVGVSALQALGEHLNLQPGQKVFIHGGTGGIGSIAIQLARHIGAIVTATAKASDAGYIQALGAHEVLDYNATDFSEVLNGFDAVFDTVGGEDFAKSLRILRPGGVAVSMIAPPDADLATQLSVSALMQSTKVTTERLTTLAQLVEAGAVKPQIGKTFPFEEIVTAFRVRESGGVHGKIVLELS